MKVKDEDLNDVSIRGVHNALHLEKLMVAMPRPPWRRDRVRGKTIAQTSLQLARYRENDTATAAIARPSIQWARYRVNDIATAAIPPPSLLLPRYRGKDTATVH